MLGEIPGTRMHTNCLKYVGPWDHVSGDEVAPILSAAGGRRLVNPPGYHPVDIHDAYKIKSGVGKNAIAIVDAWHWPTALNDFNAFSTQFGLPTQGGTNPTGTNNSVFQVVYVDSNGNKTTTAPPVDNGWATEEAIDTEWAHAMATTAKIYLVEAASSSGTDLFAAVTYAAGLPGVQQVSMSWGGGEFSGETSFDSTFVHPGVVFFASTGDDGGIQQYPAESPNIVAVGGTHVIISGGVWQSESGWSGSGGGVSAYEPIPSYQSTVSSVVGGNRGTPDISAVADPNTGCAIYTTTPDEFGDTGWLVYGGTSLACPVVAGITNARGYPTSSSFNELIRQYNVPSYSSLYMRDITTGQSIHNGSVRFNCMTGYDLVTGLGTPLRQIPTLSNVSFIPKTVTLMPSDTVRTSGALYQLYYSDSSYYVIKRNPSGNAGIQTTYVIKYNGMETMAQTQAIRVSLTALASASTPVSIKAWNYSTSAWDTVATPTLTTTKSTTLQSLSSFANYMDSNGNVQLQLQATGLASTTSISIDQFKVVADPLTH